MHTLTIALRHFRIYLPSAILIAVAIMQNYCAHVHHLDPWMAGGFGMFARVDQSRFRAGKIRCFGNSDKEIECPPNARARHQDMERALSFPSNANLRKLGQRLRRDNPNINGVSIQISTIAFDTKAPSIARVTLKETKVLQ